MCFDKRYCGLSDQIQEKADVNRDSGDKLLFLLDSVIAAIGLRGLAV